MINGVVTQIDPSDATVKFGRQLVSGSLASVSVNYEDAEYVFLFRPINALKIENATCNGRIAKMTVLARSVGTLTLNIIKRNGATVVAHVSRRVMSPGSVTLHLGPQRHGRLPDHCSVEAILKNSWGNERAILQI